MDTLNHFETRVKKEDQEHFLQLIQIALADGIVDIKETAMLHHFGCKFGFTHLEIDNLIDISSKSAYKHPYKLTVRFEQLYKIMKMVLADGVIDKNEMRLANNFAAVLSFHESEIPRLLALLIRGIKEGKQSNELFEIYVNTRKE